MGRFGKGIRGQLYVLLIGLTGIAGIVSVVGLLAAFNSDQQGEAAVISAEIAKDILYYRILPAGLIIFGTVWFITLLYIRHTTKPIVELTDKMRRVASGDFDQHMEVAASGKEDKLATAFNSMTKQLGIWYQIHENTVKERTATLDQKLHELADAKAQEDAILGSIGEGMIVTDSSGYILFINEAASELFGIPRENAFGTKLVDYSIYDLVGHLLPQPKRPLSVALSGQKITQPVQIVGPHNVWRTLFITATPVVEHAKTIGAIQIVRDITKEKEIDRMKTEFISITSHQLRTPLSAIKWFNEMLLAGDAGELNPEQKEFAQNVADSTERMIDLVSSLLNISRIESGRIIVDPKPTDLPQLVSGIVNDLKAKVEERQQHLIISIHKDLPEINLDQRLVSQVYLNLLTNAIKYTPKGGEISVFISRRDNYIISQISDNGYGIPHAEQGKMFQKFFRATNIIKVETEGTGLGMYLVKAILESSGGKIWFKSEPNQGTTFWFSLPLHGMRRQEGEVALE